MWGNKDTYIFLADSNVFPTKLANGQLLLVISLCSIEIMKPTQTIPPLSMSHSIIICSLIYTGAFKYSAGLHQTHILSLAVGGLLLNQI